MNNEQLRMFCLEQAVILYSNREEIKSLSPAPNRSLLEIASILFDYVRNGVRTNYPIFPMNC